MITKLTALLVWEGYRFPSEADVVSLTRRALFTVPVTGVPTIEPPAYHTSHETLSNRLSVMAPIVTQHQVAFAGVGNGYMMTDGRLRGGHAWHGWPALIPAPITRGSNNSDAP